ncbi:536_t:CDS:2 [Entrophospora sp. SA101]|nr:536_t:CDS:2 [Entrophospora sp. SA101]
MRKTKEQERICHLCHNTQSTKWRRVNEDALIKCKDNGIRLEVGNPNPSTNSSANASLSSNFSNNNSTKLKSFNDLSSTSQKNERLKKVGKEIYYNAKEVLQNSNMTSFNLKKITLEIDNIDYEIDFMNSNITDGNLILRQDAVVRSCDEAMISRDAYRSLSKNYPELERYYKIEYRRQVIQNIINNLVPINIFNINDNDENVESSDGAYCSIIHILNIIIPLLKSSKTFNLFNYTLKIKLSGDEYCWSLFNEELSNLKTNGYIDPENTYWNVEFFMSADWKFMQLVRGIKAPTAEYFCLYCNCSKSQRANMELQWSNDYNSKTKSYNYDCLLPLVDYKNWIPDELHLMLRISDILFESLLYDLNRNPKKFEKEISNQIILEAKRIGISKFEFFDLKSSKFKWTGLNDTQKLTFLENFQASKFYNDGKGIKIENLWKEFIRLYRLIRRSLLSNHEIDNFQNDKTMDSKLFRNLL